MHFQWDLVWFGCLLTVMVSIGQFTPPMAVNLMVSCRLTRIPMESTVPYAVYFTISMLSALLLMIIFPDIALWVPRELGFM